MDFDRLNAGIRGLRELLAAPRLDPDRSRCHWPQHAADLEEVRRLVQDEVLAPVECLVLQIADPEQQRQGRLVVAGQLAIRFTTARLGPVASTLL